MELNVKFGFIGRREGIPTPVLTSIQETIKSTKDNTGMILNMAFNYGSRTEIIDGIRLIAQEVQKGNLSPEAITEETLSGVLYTKNLPDPDLLIRTSGEKRISNFLLWQLSYAEFYFTEKYWPEFDTHEFEKALMDYQSRERRYGKVKVS